MTSRSAFVTSSIHHMRTRSGKTLRSSSTRDPTSVSTLAVKRIRRCPRSHLDHAALQTDLHRRLVDASDTAYQQTLFKYMGSSIPTLGLRMPVIKQVTSAWIAAHGYTEMEIMDAKTLAMKLFEMPHIEEKMVATLLVHETLQTRGAVGVEDLATLARLFDDGHIHGWGVTDSFSSRVIRHIAENGNAEAVEQVAAWRFANNLWRSRSCVVGLMWMAKDLQHRGTLIECCRVLVRREERFAKTCVGWALREVSRWDKELVFEFLDEHVEWLSLESIRNATKRCSQAEKAKYVSLLKMQTSRP